MSGSEIRCDVDQVVPLLDRLFKVYTDLIIADSSHRPDLGQHVIGDPGAASAAENFLGNWSEGRTRITDNLDQALQVGRAAVTALTGADTSVKQAATGSGGGRP